MVSPYISDFIFMCVDQLRVKYPANWRLYWHSSTDPFTATDRVT